MADGDPIPRTDEAMILSQVRDELRTLNQKVDDALSTVRGAGELREPAKPAAKRAAKKKPAGQSRRRDSKEA